MRLIEYARSRGRPELLMQWDKGRNLPLSPEEIGTGSEQKVWWRCEKGHNWQATVTSRVSQGRGCPYCVGKLAILGETDLATLFPKIAAQWHLTRNKHLRPDQVTAGSERSVWWQCERGHPYQSVVFSRVEGTGCPYCAGKKVWPGFNDLATTHPHLVPDWHWELNGELTPQKVTRGSHKAVWWQCREGHVWKAAVFSRTRKNASGCPVCAGVVRKKKKAEKTA